MISVEGALTVYEKCLSAASNPTFSALNPACRAIHRNPVTGTATTTTVSYINAAFAEVSGVDLTADWRTDLAGGNFGVNFMISQLLDEKTQDTVQAPVVDWKGSLGPSAHHVVEQRRVRLPDVHDGQLRPRRLEPVAALAAFAERDRRRPGRHQLQHRGRPGLRRTRRPRPGSARRARTTCSTWRAVTTMGERTTLRYGVDNLFDKAPVCTGGRSARGCASEPVRRPDGGRLLRHPGSKRVRGRERIFLTLGEAELQGCFPRNSNVIRTACR